MINSVDRWIIQAENTWLEGLNHHVEELFSGTFLPSHDHTHHRRVWNLCRRILKEIYPGNSILDPSLVEGALIAALFHDTGMILSTEKEHGRLGREICESYLRIRTGQNNESLPFRFDEILEAIEKHDSKDPSVYRGLDPERSPGILGILSVADDMDAMGLIGIYRYIEIYLKRGTNIKILGIGILRNASERYRNISRCCTCCPDLLEECRQNYDRLVSFFDMFNQQLLGTRSADELFSGHVGVVNYIRRFSVEGRIRPEYFLAQSGPVNKSTIASVFFTGLNSELEEAGRKSAIKDTRFIE